MHRPLIVAALLSASALGAQAPESAPGPAPVAPSAASAVTIDAGMTRADVIARLGAPAAERKAGAFTYLFFANGCVRSCGMDDLVILQDGRVSDAIFRGAGRHYSGASSSPAGRTPEATLGARAARVVGTPTAFDAPAPSMVAPAVREGPEPVEPTMPEPEYEPAARPAPAERPTRPTLALTDPAPTPAAAPASPRPAAQAPRRAPVDLFRITPVVADSTAKRAPADSATPSRP